MIVSSLFILETDVSKFFYFCTSKEKCEGNMAMFFQFFTWQQKNCISILVVYADGSVFFPFSFELQTATQIPQETNNQKAQLSCLFSNTICLLQNCNCIKTADLLRKKHVVLPLLEFFLLKIR